MSTSLSNTKSKNFQKSIFLVAAVLGFAFAFTYFAAVSPTFSQETPAKESEATAEPEERDGKDGSYETFAPDPERAIVYIYRPTKFGGSGVRKKVYINSEYMGRISTGRYRIFHLEPGEYVFGVLEKKDKRSLTLDLEAGEVHYIRLRIKMGLVKARGKFEIVDAEEGQEKIRKLNLAKPFDPASDDEEEENDE